MRNTLLIIFALIFVSCTPQKRLERLLSRYPNLLKDSVVMRIDTIIHKGVVFDTIKVIKHIDSIIIDTAGVSLKVYRIYDTLKVNLKTRTDTVFVKNKEVIKYVNTAKKQNAYLYILIGVVLAFILFALISR